MLSALFHRLLLAMLSLAIASPSAVEVPEQRAVSTAVQAGGSGEAERQGSVIRQADADDPIKLSLDHLFSTVLEQENEDGSEAGLVSCTETLTYSCALAASSTAMPAPGKRASFMEAPKTGPPLV